MAAALSSGAGRVRTPPPLQYEATETVQILTLENPRKGWRGAPYATVKVGEYRPGRWIFAKSIALASGEGCCSPLGRWNDSPVHDEHPTREAALEAAFQEVLRYVAKSHRPDDKAIPVIRAWAQARGAVAVQPDLFQDAVTKGRRQ